jgi:serine/threonine protein kinase
MPLLHQVGDTIADRYRILDTLGEGGGSIAYQVEDLQNGELLALKALALDRATEQKAIALFEREAQTLAQLQHSAIPSYKDYFQGDPDSDRTFYIVQELAPGKSLAQLVESGWRTSEAEVKRIAKQLLTVLSYLHELSPPVIHRDIKPQNVIYRPDGRVSLVDFGAVQSTYYSAIAHENTVVGTFGYMAPEQFIGRAVPASDLYGLAATLLFLLTHRSPADLPTRQLKIDFRSGVQISEPFADWLETMLEPDPEDRFPSAKEALAALRSKWRVKPENIIDSRNTSQTVMQIVGATVIASVISLALTSITSFLSNSTPASRPVPILNTFGIAPSKLCSAIFAQGEIDPLKEYLRRGGNPTAWCGESEGTLLNNALFRRGLALAATKLLIANGVDVNAADHDGTPLHQTVSLSYGTYGKPEIASEIATLLIAHGADVNVGLKNNNTMPMPAQVVLNKWRSEVFQWEIEGATPLHYAAGNYDRGDSPKLLKLLLSKGANVHARDNQGRTPLQYAVVYDRGGYYERGGDPRDNQGRTPLQYGIVLSYEGTGSRMENRIEIIKRLLSQGADINTQDNLGRTPLHWAVLSWWSPNDFAELLVAKGAAVNVKDHEGKTPLDWAIANNRPQLAEFLRKHGAVE